MSRRIKVSRVQVAVAIVVLMVAGYWITQFSPLSVPAVVRDRPALPSCGQEMATQLVFNLQARQCFWDAYVANRPAEFISTRPTVEGDPITSIYRILGPASIEVFVDQRRDRYSKGGWYRLECLGLTRVEMVSIGPTPAAAARASTASSSRRSSGKSRWQ